MSHGIYISMTQASGDSHRLDRIADELANQNTVGYVGVHERAKALPGPKTDLAQGLGEKVLTEVTSAGVDLRPGPLMQTGRNLDIALPEGRFLKVKSRGGAPAYTRAGNLSVDHQGTLRVGHRPLLGTEGEPVRVPAGANIAVRDDGSVRVGNTTVAQIPLFALSGQLERTAGDEVRLGAEGQATQVADTITTGALEGSNADPLRAVVDLVSVQRSFDHAMQAIDTYSQMDSRVTDIGRVG